MESKIESDSDPLNTSEEIRKKAREELNRQLQGLLNNQPIEKLTDDNIEDEVNRLMEEVDLYEKNYIPKEVDENAYNELKKFEEEFGHDLEDEKEEDEKNEKEEESTNKINKNLDSNEIIDTSSNKKINEKKKVKNNKKEEKKKKYDLNFDIEEFEKIINDDEFDSDDNNGKSSKKNNIEDDITEDREIKQLLNEYEKQLNLEVEREVEKEFKPKLDQNDIKRADALLKKDPLINEAIVQKLITKEELVLYIDYYEIFSLTNKAKKATNEHLKALDDLCLKLNEDKKNNENVEDKKNKKIDLNDEDAISKLTSEIEKKLENSEDILNKKLDYEKLIMNASKEANKNNVNEVKKENLQKILEKYNKENNKDRDALSARSNKSNTSLVSNKTGFTNFTNYSNADNKLKGLKSNTINNKNEIIEKENRPSTTRSENSNFTTEELMSVPKFTLYQNNKGKEKKQKINNSNINNANLSSQTKLNTDSNDNKITNKTFYKNNNDYNDKELLKQKALLKPISKDKIKTNRNPKINDISNSNILNVSNASNISGITGKKIMPPIKNSKNNNGIKSQTNQRVDLFDDDANPLNMGKFRGARKDLIKLKMGGKSKMHELFSDKPRNLEDNERLRQKFMDFIQAGKDNNINSNANPLKKSIVRKKIEEAQKFNKLNK